MNIAVALFTYNRSEYTKKVLEALSHNHMTSYDLLIFHDGKKSDTDPDEWEKVEKTIRSVAWCKAEIITEKRNKGLANSIIDGVNYAFLRHEAVVVLEDDCIPHPQFMEYMSDCLKQFVGEKRVWQIGGSAWNTDVPQDEYDVYFNQRTSSYGWATWKDRWEFYERDYMILKRIKADSKSNKRLEIWGDDLQDMLEGNLTGRCDSWSVFWSLKVIEKDGVCISPYKSLVRNIGFDGSGTHGVSTRIYWEQRPQDDMTALNYPKEIQIRKTTEDAFRVLTHKTAYQEKYRISQKLLIDCLRLYNSDAVRIPFLKSGDIAIWGMGPMCDYILDEISYDYTIKGIIVSYPNCKDYRGYRVFSIEEFHEKVDAIVVIPFFEKETIMELAKLKKKPYKMYGFDECILSMRGKTG